MALLIALTWARNDQPSLRSDGSFGEESSEVRDEMSARYGMHTDVSEELTVA